MSRPLPSQKQRADWAQFTVALPPPSGDWISTLTDGGLLVRRESEWVLEEPVESSTTSDGTLTIDWDT